MSKCSNNKMRKIFFDIETSNIFQEVGSRNPANLNLSIMAIYDSETEEYSSYLQEELPKLWPIFENAGMLIGFYSDKFDIPLLDKYYPGDLTKIKHLDLLAEIKKVLGRSVSLGKLAEGTLGAKKGGDGLQATNWWKKGEIEKVRKYCIQDVKVTKEIYDYAVKYGKLKFKEDGRIHEFDIDGGEWEKGGKNSITHTLPF
jgi:DEAD/DEAH box helicase domain-containing protein